MKEYIITMTAANRVGILAAVTKAMEELGGDLREASQTVVRGFFTMIFSAEFPKTLAPEIIVDHLQDNCRPFGIEVHLTDVESSNSSGTETTGGRLYSLRLGGDNQKGALRELSSLLSLRRIDIAGMYAVRTKSGSGFEMKMKISVPADCDLDQCLKEINNIGRQFNVTAEVADYP